MKVYNHELCIGAQEPFMFLHMSDTHLTLADHRDDAHKNDLALHRQKSFPNSENTLLNAIRLAEEHQCMIAHTGDLIDFVSWKNLDAAKSFTSKCDVFMSAGNHEFSLYVGEAFEDEAYRNKSLDTVQSVFKNNIRYSSRKINGVNLIAIDNSYYLIDRTQLDFLKSELALKMPTLLFMHTPIYSEYLYDLEVKTRKNECAFLMNAPAEKIADYPEHRIKQQTPDETTKAAYELILHSNNIKAIITGHLHTDTTDLSFDGMPQFVTDCNSFRLFKIK